MRTDRLAWSQVACDDIEAQYCHLNFPSVALIALVKRIVQ